MFYLEKYLRKVFTMTLSDCDPLSERCRLYTIDIKSQNQSEQYPKAFAEAENGGAEVIVIKSAKPGVFSKGQDLTANKILFDLD